MRPKVFFRHSMALCVALLLLLLGGMRADGNQVLFEDDFGGIATGAPPAADQWRVLTPTEGDYWTARDGALFTGNLLDQPPSYALVDVPDASGWRDVRVSADFRMLHGSGSVILSVRARDGRNQYICYFTASAGGGGAVERSVEIVRLTNGIPLPLATLRGERANLPAFEGGGRSWRMEFEARGDDLIAYFDGREILRATDGSYSTGTVGVGAANTTASFEFVAVTPAGVAAPSVDARRTPAPARVSWRILLREGMTRQQADRVRSDLAGQVDEVVVLPRGGSFAVYIGDFASEQEARRSLDRYVALGLIPRSIERVGPSGDVLSSPQSGYRVLVGLYNTRQQAEARADQMQYEEGFFPVSIVSDGSSHKVFLGETFPGREEAEAFAQALMGEGIDQVGVYRLGDNEAIGLSYIAEAASSTAAASLSADERDRVVELFAEMERLRREGSQAERRQVEDTVREMDPQQRRFLEEMEGLRGGSEVITDEPHQVVPLPTSPPPRVSAAEIIQGRKEEARRQEEAGEYSAAIQTWNIIKATDPSGQSLNEANEAISRLQRRIDEQTLPPRATTATTPGDGGLNLALIGGIVLVVAVGGAVGFFLLKRRKAPKPAAAPVRSPSSATTPIPTITSIKGGTAGLRRHPAIPVSRRESSPTSEPAGQAPATASNNSKREPEPEEEKHEIVDSSARIRPGVMSPAPPREEEETGALPRGDDDAIPLSALGLGEEKKPAAPPKPAPARPAKAAPRGKPQPAPPQQEPAPDPAPTATANLFYEQSFDGEPLGEAPSNWKGLSDYDYASLRIVERRGGGRCMRFEKHSGTGSAYYSCRFPDASGRFHVEFDICCDDKNKYLLGFYIEKDEDFRQSVSTVIHGDTSRADAVTLRLQNEVTTCEFGQWRKVRFLIDLQRHIVDAYVDGEAIAMGIRLNSRPDVLNTLSIRDNLATEGVLMIDNIRISPVE